MTAAVDIQTGPELHSSIQNIFSRPLYPLLHPDAGHHAAAIASVKHLLDPLATSVVDAQQLRKRGNKKRKRKDLDEADKDIYREVPLHLRQVHSEGFGVVQVWEQARRILDSARAEVERDLAVIQASTGQGPKNRPTISRQSPGAESARLENGFSRSDSSDAKASIGGSAVFHSDYETDITGELQHKEGEEDLPSDEEEVALSDDDERSFYHMDDEVEHSQQPQTYVDDPNGLNDGFFSIDDFNKQAQFLEQHDAMGQTDDRSDEDEVDWDVDPLSVPLSSRNGVDEAPLGDNDDDSIEAAGFGNTDLGAESDEEDQDAEEHELEAGMSQLDNTNDIKYVDFFEPPPKKAVKSRSTRSSSKSQPPPKPDISSAKEQDIDGDIQRAISDVRRDLLESEDEMSSEEESHNALPANRTALWSKTKSDANQNLSTHEKQVAQLTSEIRRLESAAVAKRDWTLSGEARATDRPLNSLMAEDLEFERAGKPVPVITAEVSEELEALIKRRIINRQFDELIRRRPDAAGVASSVRRGRAEIDDSKPSQGLADIYEAEHLKATDPNYVDQRSVALKKQHAEIERLWKDVNTKLDMLSNLHFRPKRAEVNIEVVTDKPVLSMEDARPGGADVETITRLAPQEIYHAGEDGQHRGEVLDHAGLARSKEELTREEKLRIRRREKAREKKRKANEGTAIQQQQQQTQQHQRANARGSKGAGKLQDKRNILDELKKGGVKVIGRGGEVEAIDGKRQKGLQGGEKGSTSWKL